MASDLISASQQSEISSTDKNEKIFYQRFGIKYSTVIVIIGIIATISDALNVLQTEEICLHSY